MGFNDGFFVQPNTSGVSYAVYTALLTQTGTNAPVATILENTLGGVPVWSYDSVGFYKLTLVGAFTIGKTTAFITPYGNTVTFNVSANSDVNEIFINSATLTVGVYIDGNDLLVDTPIEIRVYP